ncbi:PUB4 [Symbiodinium natans]|uniref:PUB4 protein n=1 Tax=Symbiodinium natans TaxID=878477 RepID=A0A812HH79_9DINO|nr:PUB4 [Symbiodinium natans]
MAETAEIDQLVARAKAGGGIEPLVALLTAGSEKTKENAARALKSLAYGNADNKVRIAKAGAIEPLVALVHTGSDEAKDYAKVALSNLAFQNEAIEKDIVTSRQPRQENAACALKYLAYGDADNKVRIAKAAKAGAIEPLVALLTAGSEKDKENAACALKYLAYGDADNKVRIAKAGAIEPLVALVHTGSDEAKGYAKVALSNLAFQNEAIEKDIEAAKARSSKAKPAEQALTVPSVPSAPSASSVALPSGKGARVAMFSARFDGGQVEKTFREVHRILRENRYDVMMVEADSGENFGDMTTAYLGRLQREKGIMLSVCTEHYGEKTASAYSSFKELKFALDYEADITVVPLRVEDIYPPRPGGGPKHQHDPAYLAQSYVVSVFKPSLVFEDCRGKPAAEIAAVIAKRLRKETVSTASPSGSGCQAAR